MGDERGLPFPLSSCRGSRDVFNRLAPERERERFALFLPSNATGGERMKPVEKISVAGVFIFLVFFFLGFSDLDYTGVPLLANQTAWSVEHNQTAESVEHNQTAGSVEHNQTAGSVEHNQTAAVKEKRGDGQCDIFEGKWIWDESYPLYQSRDCPFIDSGFRCAENGRPDNSYTKWRWQPVNCNWPRFDAKEILERLRGRRVAFVGDSIGRNQWESLLCMLSSAISDKTSIYEINGSPITKHNGFLSFIFKPYNCTVEYYRAPFLVSQGRPPRRSPPEIRSTLKLDLMDWSSVRWRTADLLVFNTGHWWNYEKTLRSGNYFQVGKQVKMELTVEEAYRRSIETLLDWAQKEVNSRKSLLALRTYAPVHFRSGTWKTGGGCHNQTLPDFEGPPAAEHWALRTAREAMERRGRRRSDVALVNVTQMTAQRRDGHASIYYLGPGKVAQMHRQDCSHWCLPGVPDTWNELLLALFLEWDRKKP